MVSVILATLCFLRVLAHLGLELLLRTGPDHETAALGSGLRATVLVHRLSSFVVLGASFELARVHADRDEAAPRSRWEAQRQGKAVAGFS